jgi:signal transduction histidine kinase
MLKRLLTRAGQIAVTFIGFALLNTVATAFQVETGVSILFPATGFGIVCTMFFGPIAAIGIIGATMVTPWGPSADMTLFVSGVISAIEALIPWLLFHTRRDLQGDLRDMKSLLVFLLFGTVVNTGFSAVAGNLLVIEHPEGLHLVWHEIFVWWLADFTAALLIAMPILAFSGALRRGSASERQPRTIVNTLQIVTAIILFGFAASFATRTYLLNQLEGQRLDQQQVWWETEETLNKMHGNFLRAAFISLNDPRALQMVGDARRLNERYVTDLETAFHDTPHLAARFPIVAEKTREWFSEAESAVVQRTPLPRSEEIVHRTSEEIGELHGTLDSVNASAWNVFASKRTKLMLVANMVDGLVFAILILASVTLLWRVSQPLKEIRGAIDGMRDGEPLDARRISSPYLEFRSIASALEETSRELRDREIALRLQTDRAVAASKHKSEFLAKMSHELRTPLNSIIGFSELLAEQETTIESSRRLAFLSNVSSSARHLLHLINDLLDIAKVESGKMKLHFENVDLRLAIANTVASTTPLFQRKRQELEVALPSEPMMARADISRVEQVLLNLLANANKFSAEGQKIHIRSSASDANSWHIEVIDHGIGISADDQKRIFDEFEQVHPRGPASSGTGLGLALAKRFVEMHGGAIAVESLPGAGARFSIRLPRAMSAEP